VNSEHLKNIVWDRVQPFLEKAGIEELSTEGDEGVANTAFFGEYCGGKWQAKELNPLFRLCKYEPGGHFGPHRDGCF